MMPRPRMRPPMIPPTPQVPSYYYAPYYGYESYEDYGISYDTYGESASSIAPEQAVTATAST